MSNLSSQEVCTSVLQPLDVSLNKPFKDLMRHKWLGFMEKSLTDQEKKRQEEEAELSDDPLASSDEETTDEIRQLLVKKPKPIIVKPASRRTVVDWIASTNQTW